MRRFVSLMLFLLLAGTATFAQEFRATLSGHVIDSSGAVIPKAVVIVLNVNKGIRTKTTANGQGVYTVPFLEPGTYSITVSAEGFRTYIQDGVTLQAGDKVEQNVTLDVGAVSEEVRVSADAPLIQTATATAGQVLTPEEIENLPNSGRSPLGLARTEYGVNAKQKHSVTETRPFDNSGASDISIGGGNAQSNEVLLNGVPNMQDSGRVSAFSPLQDAVSEIRVDVFEADASYGDTSNGTINLVTKAGTNSFHGAASEFNQYSGLNAPNRWFSSAGSTQPVTRQNQYGIAVGGPVLLPKLFNGRNKLFFFYAYEAFKGSDPNPNTTTVPTVAERQGDFSGLLALGKSYQLYDPATGKTTSGKVTRSAFTNNIIPEGRLNSEALKYLQYYPQPNVTGAADGENNYYSNVPTLYDYNSNQGRIDYSLGSNDQIFSEIHRSNFIQSQGNIFKNISTGSKGITNFWGGLVDHVHTFSPTLTIDSRLGVSRSFTLSTLNSENFDATSLGFPSYLNTYSTAQYMPQISFSESGTAYAGLSTKPGNLQTFYTIQLFSALTKLVGNHTIKVGPDIRLNKLAKLSPGSSSGAFTFGSNFMSQGTGYAAPTFGSSFASFLLGLPQSGTYNVNTATTSSNWYYGFFAQDDWKISRRLILNIGVRFEHETPVVESNNKAVVNWDPTLANAVTSAAVAAYTAHPISQLPVASFSPTGGLYFATADHRNAYNTPALYVSPRIGFSYNPPILRDGVVIRGGAGIYVNPFNDYNTSQTYGYSAATSLVSTTDNYQTAAMSLSNPFPSSNSIQTPVGSSQGINTYLGNGIQFVSSNVQVPYVIRWNLDVQQRLSNNMMIDVGYIGNHSVHQSYSNALSSAPLIHFMTHAAKRDQTLTTTMGASVANPFYGLIPNTSLGTSKTISAATLLLSHPEYSSVTQALVPGGGGLFNELLLRFQKRMSNGLMFNVNYEWSHLLATGQLFDAGPQVYGGSTSDFPNHVAVTGSYQLPFGRGQKFFHGANRGMNLLVGGFTTNLIYQYLSGSLIQWKNAPVFANGTSFDSQLKIHPRSIKASLDKTLFDTVSNDQPNSYNYRTFPTYFGRQDSTNNFDASVLKDFSFGERLRLQYRFEAFNLLNHTSFSTPNVSPTSSAFGTISAQANNPRSIQQGLRIVF